MWSLFDFKVIQTNGEGKEYLTMTHQDEYDCNNETTQNLAIAEYAGRMGNGYLIQTLSSRDELQPIIPDTIAEFLWKIACKKK